MVFHLIFRPEYLCVKMKKCSKAVFHLYHHLHLPLPPPCHRHFHLLHQPHPQLAFPALGRSTGNSQDLGARLPKCWNRKGIQVIGSGNEIIPFFHYSQWVPWQLIWNWWKRRLGVRIHNLVRSRDEGGSKGTLLTSRFHPGWITPTGRLEHSSRTTLFCFYRQAEADRFLKTRFMYTEKQSQDQG